MMARSVVLGTLFALAGITMARPADAQTVWGDVNGDGAVTAVDAQAILTAAVDLALPAGFIKDHGDANCDGAVTAVDAQIVLSLVVALPVSQFCVGQPAARPVTSKTYSTGLSTSPVSLLENGSNISAASWTSSGFTKGPFLQSSYSDAGRGIDVRAVYGTSDVPTRIYDAKSKSSITIVMRADRVDYQFYDASGQYVSAIAVTWQSGKLTLAKVNSTPALTGQVSALSNALSFSAIGKPDASLGTPVDAAAKFVEFHNAGLSTSASTATAAFQRRLVQAGLLAISGASTSALGISSIPQDLVAAGLLAIAISNHPNQHSASPDAFETTLAKFVEDGVSLGRSPAASLAAAHQEIEASGTLAPKDLGKLTTKSGSSSDVVPAIVAASAMQAATGGPPAASATIEGYAVDNTDVMYTLTGSVSAGGQLSATGTPASGTRSVTISGTVTGASFSGSYSGSPGSGSLTGTVAPLGACQTQNSSGGQGTFVKTFNMGSVTGDVTFTYEAYSIKDAFKVAHAGETVLNTGLVSGSGTKTFPLKSSSIVFVTVSAPTSGTAWDFTLACPKAAAANVIAINAGDNQTAAAGTAVPVAPSVKVTSPSGAGVSGVTVTFAVASGGGSITGASQVTNSSGIATVGSWTLGSAPGANTLTAASAGASGSPVTFTATASGSIVIASVAPTPLTPGVSATITGTGFSTTASANVVTIDGVLATVTSASATQLTVTVPAALPCKATHDGPVKVTVGSDFGAKDVPIQAAKQRAMTVGQALIITDAAETRCNELSATGGTYYIDVFNASTTYTSTGAQFELRGEAATPNAANPAASLGARARAPLSEPQAPVDPGAALHFRILEETRQLLNTQGIGLAERLRASRPAFRSIAVPVLGETVSLMLPNTQPGNGCRNPLPLTGKIVYVGTKSIIVEDNANTLAGQMSASYTQIGQEFDNTMFKILEDNFGNPLAMDPLTDNNGRIVMVFSNKVNTNSPGIAGFVIGCDLFPRDTTNNTASNFGEYFYAMAPTTLAGTIDDAGSVAQWVWSMRSTVIHEVKHITSRGERASRNGQHEESWLEETGARLSEELYTRKLFGLNQKANLPFGTSGNGLHCEWYGCDGKPLAIAKVFHSLATQWYASPHTSSPLGRTSSTDFSFYATGWSLLRWALDNSTTAEATFLKAMTQGPSKVGVANLEAQFGQPFGTYMLPRWTLAMALDDFTGFTPADPSLKQPSWNLPDVFKGQNAIFTSLTLDWPLVANQATFGTFSINSSVVPGTASFTVLSGSQTAKQLVELKASGSSSAAPADLRIAIVRVK